MIESLCILVRRAPYGVIHAAEALRHTAGALTEELRVTTVFIDDGVYTAKNGQQAEGSGWASLSHTIEKIFDWRQKMGKEEVIRIYAHAPSLSVRGLEADDLVPGIGLINDKELVEVLANCQAVMVY